MFDGSFSSFFSICYISFAGRCLCLPHLCSREQEGFPMSFLFSGDSGGPLKPTFIMNGGHLNNGGHVSTDGGTL